MGTRAVVHFGDQSIATHWDGYPDGLGKDLLAILPNPTLDKVIEVCEKHTIDFATKAIKDIVSPKRWQAIADKANENENRNKTYTAQDIADLETRGEMLVFGLMSAKDYPIGDFADYDDWANYEYIVEAERILVRHRSGRFNEAIIDGDYEVVK